MNYPRRIVVCTAPLCLLAGIVTAQTVFPPQITSDPPPPATIGMPYSFTFKVSNGTPPYAWSSFGLPPWSSLNSSTGVLSGTPPANSAASYTFTVFVVDSEMPPMSTSAQYTLQVNAPPPVLHITTTSVPPAYVGSPYTFAFGAASGMAPYSYSITGLPQGSGLSLTSSGLLTGTPSANSAGTYTITLTVKDSQNASDSKSFTFLVNSPLPPLRITTSSLPAGSVGVDYSQTIQASGGAPPYKFAIIATIFGANAPPPGLTLSQSGILAGVPTKSGTYSFTVTVIDSLGNEAVSQQPLAVTFSPQFLITTGSPLPPGTLGISYSQMIAVTGGTTPYNFSATMGAIPGLTLNVNGLLSGTPSAPGTFPFTIQVTDGSRIVVTKQFEIKITASPPALIISAQALAFTSSGGEDPPPQAISVFSTSGNPVSYGVRIDGGSSGAPAPAWLIVKPLAGFTPARLTALVSPGILAPNTYVATIHLTVPTDPSQAPIDIPVTLTVASAPARLSVAPTFLRFAGRFQAPGILAQALVVRNSGVGGLTYSIVGKSLWIADVTPLAGLTTANSPVFLQVRVNTTGLQPGSYRDVIHITSSAGSMDVPVTLFMAAAGPIFGIGQTGIRFKAQAGVGIPSPQAVQIFNLGDPGLAINWTAALIGGADWLSLGAGATGTATAAKPGNLTLSPNSNVLNLPPGQRYALIRLSDPNAVNSPQYVVAVMDIAPASNAPLPDLAPAGLVFTSAGGAQPAQQTVRVYTTSAASVPYQIGTATSDGASWLSVDSASGTASLQNPGQIAVSVNPAGMSAGIYTAEISIAMSGTLRGANVTLIVTAAGGCSPAHLALTHTGIANNFNVPAGLPATLAVQLNDDCGTPVLNGSIVASFSNGDPPLSLAGDRLTGTYSATWQPGKAVSPMTITAQAAAGMLAPASAQLIGGISPNSAPVLSKNGVVNNSNPLGGSALAPGTVAQVYGAGLATMTVSPGVVPLVTDFNGTNMLVGGVDAPLYYLSDGQLNVQIPFELAPNRQYAVVVGVNNAFTLPDTIDIVPVAPGVTAFPDGRLIAQHAADLSTLVDAAHPAKPGEILTIYLAGMGATTPVVPSALAAPSAEPFARTTVQPVVTVDGQDAVVLFAGLTPGGVGLYQINFQVPLTAKAGILNVVVTQGGVPANTTRLLTVQ